MNAARDDAVRQTIASSNKKRFIAAQVAFTCPQIQVKWTARRPITGDHLIGESLMAGTAGPIRILKL